MILTVLVVVAVAVVAAAVAVFVVVVIVVVGALASKLFHCASFGKVSLSKNSIVWSSHLLCGFRRSHFFMTFFQTSTFSSEGTPRLYFLEIFFIKYPLKKGFPTSVEVAGLDDAMFTRIRHNLLFLGLRDCLFMDYFYSTVIYEIYIIYFIVYESFLTNYELPIASCDLKKISGQ